MAPSTDRRIRRGSTVAYVALALPVIGMFAALGVENVYLNLVHVELQGVADAASHAAMLRLDGTDAGLIAAKADAIDVVTGARVNSRTYVLTTADIQLGTYDETTGAFVESAVAGVVNSVRVPLVESNVGIGLGMMFFGKEWSVQACSAIMRGAGNASAGVIGGPGLANGHFDYDSTDARLQCAGGSTCFGTAQHTHEFDDKSGNTWVDQFTSGTIYDHLPVDGCDEGGTPDKKGKIDTTVGACGGSFTRVIPDGTPFKIIIANADLSPGGWVTINGTSYDVAEYDDTAFASLPTYTIGPGGNVLTDLQMDFDINAIANCELIPTNTGDMKENIPGINGEWRSGALTMQLVRAASPVFTSGKSSGDHDVVINENDGLLWEGTFFWHWDGPSYIASEAAAWQAQYDGLDCGRPIFIDQRLGGSVCGG